MKVYDAHIHFFYDCPADELKRHFEAYEHMGVAGMDVLVISEFPSEIETVFHMIPGSYHPHVNPTSLKNQKDPFPVFNLTEHLRIIPFLDARFIDDHMGCEAPRPILSRSCRDAVRPGQIERSSKAKRLDLKNSTQDCIFPLSPRTVLSRW